MRQMRWLVAAALCAGVMTARAQSVTVAVVDLEELVRLHPNTVSDKKLLEQTLKEYKAEGDDLQQKLEKLQDEFEKARREAADPVLSDKARGVAEEQTLKKREALVMAERQARETMQMRQKQLSEQELRMLKRTTGEIREAVEKYAAANRILLVLPATAVISRDKALDITDPIMKKLNIVRPTTNDAPAAIKDAPRDAGKK